MRYDYTDLDTRITKEDKMFKASVREFAEKEIRPVAMELDKLDANDTENYTPIFKKAIKKIREMDFHVALMPESMGGLELNPLQFHIMLEELGYASAGLTFINIVDGFPAIMALKSQRPDLIEEFAIPFIEDKKANVHGCWLGTEPDHGSDLANLSHDHLNNTEIKLDMESEFKEGHFITNGQKSAWITNGPAATCGLLYTSVEHSKGLKGSASFIVPLDLKGISKGAATDKIGQRDLPQSEVFFDQVEIPEKYLLFPPAYFHETFEQTLTLGNSCVGPTMTGLARAAFEEALTYAKGRVQGGKVICKHQLIQKKLFDMFMKIESARAISRSVLIHNLSNSKASLMHAATAKVYCTQIAIEVASEALQVFGGYGLTKEFPVEKFYRDARCGTIEDGTTEALTLDAADAIIRTYK